MLSLAVDTSSSSGSLAVLQDAAILGAVMTCGNDAHSSKLFRHLDFLLTELGVRMYDFNFYSVASGPGSFTGLRVGLTAVKGWAEVYEKKVAAVSILDAIAAQAPGSDGLLASVLDARRGEVYGCVYRKSRLRGEELGQNPLPVANLQKTSDEVVMTPAAFVEFAGEITGDQPVTFATATPAVLSEALENSKLKSARVGITPTLLAPAIGQLGYARFICNQAVDSMHVEANYVRRCDAELLWKGP